MTDPTALRAHEDAELFRQAVTFTAAQTRFPPGLIEKDYFCSVLLRHLAQETPGLVFRGGTSLAKVHLGFYRLSEDLDFLISTPVDASRAERSEGAAELKAAVASIRRCIPGLRVVGRLTGANESRQYNAEIGYTSLVAEGTGTVRIEVGLREPLLTPAIGGGAQTLLLDPLTGTEMVPLLPILCFSREEAMAEKLRAALSRREPAIRDFYDVDHAVRHAVVRTEDTNFLDLVKRKLAVPRNEPVDVSTGRLTALRRQVDAQLRPVLREEEFAAFDLDRAYATVRGIAAALTRGQERAGGA